MIDIEAILALEDEPQFMFWVDGAGTVEFSNI